MDSIKFILIDLDDCGFTINDCTEAIQKGCHSEPVCRSTAQAGLIQNLQSLIKFGDTGSRSGMTKFSLVVSPHPFG